MGTRLVEIFSCDWCPEEARFDYNEHDTPPLPKGWTMLSDDGQMICDKCSVARNDAIEDAKKERIRAEKAKREL